MDRGEQRRRPETGGYARGDEKRTRIIEAALRRFGEEGYRGASTRRIAQDAGANAPAIQYYFDTKEGLYLACGEYFLERFGEALQHAYASADQVGKDKAAALDALCTILEATLEFLLDTMEEHGWGRFVTRAQRLDDAGPISGEGRSFKDDLNARCMRLVSVIIGPRPKVEVTLKTYAILGQFSIFYLNQSEILAKLGWPNFRGARLKKLSEMLLADTRAALSGESR